MNFDINDGSGCVSLHCSKMGDVRKDIHQEIKEKRLKQSQTRRRIKAWCQLGLTQPDRQPGFLADINKNYITSHPIGKRWVNQTFSKLYFALKLFFGSLTVQCSVDGSSEGFKQKLRYYMRTATRYRCFVKSGFDAMEQLRSGITLPLGASVYQIKVRFLWPGVIAHMNSWNIYLDWTGKGHCSLPSQLDTYHRRADEAEAIERGSKDDRSSENRHINFSSCWLVPQAKKRSPWFLTGECFTL